MVQVGLNKLEGLILALAYIRLIDNKLLPTNFFSLIFSESIDI